MLTWPVELTGTMTRLGTVSPATKLRLEATGCVAPDGHTVRKLVAVGLVTVTFNTTADTPEEGTPPLVVPVGLVPVAWMVRVPPADSVLPRHCESVPDRPEGFPVLVSQIREEGGG